MGSDTSPTSNTLQHVMLTWYLMFHSSSPSKRNLKPSPFSASPSQLTMNADGSALHQMGHPGTVDAYGAYSAQPMPQNPRKRRASGQQLAPAPNAIAPAVGHLTGSHTPGYGVPTDPSGYVTGPTDLDPPPQAQPAPKKGRTNTPWTPAEEQRLKVMRDAGNSWSEIAKVSGSKSLSRRRPDDGHFRMEPLSLRSAITMCASMFEWQSNLSIFSDVPDTNGRKREETLVQGKRQKCAPNRVSCSANEHAMKDMHYAEFAENEVSRRKDTLRGYDVFETREANID